jgi:hypothetical protein
MPLVRYFLFTGGVLLALLFWTDWYFPRPAVEAATADVDRSIIRIHSSHRWPAAVRFDTTTPIPRAVAVAAAEAESSAAEPATSLKHAYAFEPTPAIPSAQRPHRRAKPILKLSSREARRRVASTQPNWFSW